MGAPAKKAPQDKSESTAASGPADTLLRELLDVAKKATKSGKLDEAMHHLLGAVIVDINLSQMSRQPGDPPSVTLVGGSSLAINPERLDQVRKLAAKAFGSDQKKLFVAFADVHSEINELIAPITKPLDLKTALQFFRNALAE